MNTIDSYPDTDTLQDFLRIKSQVHILYSQSKITFIFPVLAAFCLGIVLWDIATRQILYIWIGVVISHSLLRYFLLWQYWHTDITPDNASSWLTFFILAAITSGIIWGTAGIVLVPYDIGKIMQFTIYNSLTILIICGLVAGAVISYSINMWVLFSYSFPTLVPPAFYLISLGDNFNSAFGGFILLFYFFITVAAYRMNSQFKYYIDMEYQQKKIERHYVALNSMYNDMRKGMKKKNSPR